MVSRNLRHAVCEETPTLSCSPKRTAILITNPRVADRSSTQSSIPSLCSVHVKACKQEKTSKIEKTLKLVHFVMKGFAARHKGKRPQRRPAVWLKAGDGRGADKEKSIPPYGQRHRRHRHLQELGGCQSLHLRCVGDGLPER